jgi:hypothetical protein
MPPCHSTVLHIRRPDGADGTCWLLQAVRACQAPGASVSPTPLNARTSCCNGTSALRTRGQLQDLAAHPLGLQVVVRDPHHGG